MKTTIIRVPLTIILASINLLTFANGDPVARFSSINCVRNPEPLSIPEIAIVREKLKITHEDGYNCFDITYLFKNESDKDFREIDYGFPIDYHIIDELESYKFHHDLYTESIYEAGWNERLIKDICFTFNSSELAFHSAKESVEDVSFEINPYDDNEEELVPIEGINRRWFYTQFSMKPREQATLNVRYKVYANSHTSASDGFRGFACYNRKDISSEYGYYNLSFLNRYFPDQFYITYDFSPAKHFGDGKPYYLEIDIDLRNIENPIIRSGHTWWYADRMERIEYNVKADEIKPIDLTVSLINSSVDKSINQAIDKYAVSEAEYEVTTEADIINIDFQKPIFVSDLACDIDTAGVNQINAIVTYSDGRQKQYEFKRYEDRRYCSYTCGNIPTLLTVTDIYDDMAAKNDAKDVLKIKNIKLSFESVSASALKGVKVVDARFEIESDK